MNKLFSVKNILTGRAASELKDTVIGVLADTGSRIAGCIERQKSFSAGSMKRVSSAPAGKSHEQWKSEAIYRALQDRQ